jgi:hypothetical protein
MLDDGISRLAKQALSRKTPVEIRFVSFVRDAEAWLFA